MLFINLFKAQGKEGPSKAQGKEGLSNKNNKEARSNDVDVAYLKKR